MALLCFFMPLHTMLFDVIIPGSIDNFWRDALLVCALLTTLLKRSRSGQLHLKLGKYGINIFLMAIVSLFYVLLSDQLWLAVRTVRTYLMPLIIYFIIVNMNTSEEYINCLEKIIVYEAFVLSIWGIFQALVLGDSFLVKLGYPSLGEHLSSASFYINGYFGAQRNTATFVSPNTFGVYLAVAIILFQNKYKEYKHGMWILFCLAAGLVTTFSRSAMLGVIIAILVLKLKKRTIQIRMGKMVPFLLLMGAGIVVDAVLLEGRTLEMLWNNVAGAITLTDASAQKHLMDLVEPIAIIMDHPLGLGLGNNGPLAISLLENANAVESSIYLLMYNFGILGGIIFLWPYMRESLRCLQRIHFAEVSGGVCIMVLVTYLLLPNVETYEILFFVYLLIAMGEKRSYLYQGSKSYSKLEKEIG